jgi:hypothetical protein
MLVCLNCENTHVSLTSDRFSPPRRPLDAAPLRDLGRQYASARSGKDLAKLLGIGGGFMTG